MITKCPAWYNDGLLDSIPISDKEVYEIDSSQKSKLDWNLGCNNNDDNNDNIVPTKRFKMNIISYHHRGRQSSGKMMEKGTRP